MSSDDRSDKSTSTLQAYLKEIRHIDPLTMSEEIKLARCGSEAALQELVKHNLKYVVKVASRYKGMGLSFTDLINEGNIGMIHAAKRYNPDRRVKFITYAVWWVRQSILQALAYQAKVVRLPVKQAGLLTKITKTVEKLSQKYNREPTMEELAAELQMRMPTLETIMRVYRSYMSLDSPLNSEDDTTRFVDMLEADPLSSVEEDFIRLCLHHDIEKLLKSLGEREELVLRMRYGFDEPPMTLEQIGSRLGLTRERIRQIEKTAKEKLKTKSGIKALEDYLL